MQAIVIILQILPELIKAIEAAMPGEGQGEKKLALLRQWVEAFNSDVMPMWPQIAAVAALLVKAFNSLGVFKKAAS